MKPFLPAPFGIMFPIFGCKSIRSVDHQLNMEDHDGIVISLEEKAVQKRFYEITYRYFRPGWESDVNKRTELMSLVESERNKPCRAIDLGCGSGENVVYLAQKGFDVIGVDYAEAGIESIFARITIPHPLLF